MTIELTEWQARIVLEALTTLDDKWLGAIKATDDEDVKAEYGNDRGQLYITKQHVESEACKAYGPAIKELSKIPA